MAEEIEMNWQKYSKCIAQNPDLGPCFAWHIGPASLQGSHPNHPDFASIQEWVQQEVEYVAIRPFDSLDLKAGNAKEMGRVFQQTDYAVWFHIAEEEGACARFRSVNHRSDEEAEGEHTLTEVVEHLIAWYGEYWAKQGRALVIDAITRHARWRTGWERYGRESLEIYRVPLDFLERFASK